MPARRAPARAPASRSCSRAPCSSAERAAAQAPPSAAADLRRARRAHAARRAGRCAATRRPRASRSAGSGGFSGARVSVPNVVDPSAYAGAAGPAQLRRLGGLVLHDFQAPRAGHLRAQLPVGELPRAGLGRRARARLPPRLLPAVRSPRAAGRRAPTRWWCGSTGATPAQQSQRRLSPDLVQLGRARRRGQTSAPIGASELSEPDDPDDAPPDAERRRRT